MKKGCLTKPVGSLSLLAIKSAVVGRLVNFDFRDGKASFLQFAEDIFRKVLGGGSEGKGG